LQRKFNELMHCINDNYDNIKFIIVGSQSEKNIYLEKINDGINKDQIIDLMGETLTLTGAYMLKSNLFIGNDSGLMHLSTASHLPTIGLFGPTNDKIYAPKCDNCYVMRTKESYEYFLKNIRDTSKSYMDSIQVNDVINIIKEKKLLK
jgi:ADP-heptose:LPS heptosyltransferase